MKKTVTICCLMLLMFVYSLQVSAEEEINNEENDLISISGSFSNSNQLFDLENLKPGDWSDRELTITNQTPQEIQYDLHVTYLDGSEMFYNNLELEVKINDEIVFNDKLANFNKVNGLLLAANATEKVNFHILFPPELGNEFQGLTTQAEIIITAFDETNEEETSFDITTDSNGDSGARMPDTASFIFNFLLIGAGLLLIGSIYILFSKRKRTN
ncbi:hypothetical protein JCM21714_3735 [Gracilibacillus boraciitolerans JCM 21714]|uniref:Gram-positive cocci surface proteins LPxTG domain-containing protein n=1 Tax=Gracilibacillus boraciitolerans JCM 21714 TaxID=1298598 RepID=W4VN03_9BACI|nr:LPXTG cell wall anchor domain-containing protein [Gracilibacillus boraciitolerans]GAE94567.1 hypothetical protein JCM21714_3735 [Gracilibacillus boraciitolerans JCM 21714]